MPKLPKKDSKTMRAERCDSSPSPESAAPVLPCACFSNQNRVRKVESWKVALVAEVLDFSEDYD